MTSLTFLCDEDWDFPFFKKLPANDTSNAPGHQGGMVIPIALRKFFPMLTGEPTTDNPTVDHPIRAILMHDGRVVASVITRYQIQSWGGTRTPETRLTRNLGPIRKHARAGDFLVIQRSLRSLDLYRLCLISQSGPLYSPFATLVGTRRWGVIYDDAPVTQQDMEMSDQEQAALQADTFRLFDEQVARTETKTKRLARSMAFSSTLYELYDYVCAACGVALKSPHGPVELDAAHIVPRSRYGTDDPRNGLALCKRHHWAFDNGLFSVKDNSRIFVPKAVKAIPCNSVLTDLAGRQIRQAKKEHLSPDPIALAWHMENVLIQ